MMDARRLYLPLAVIVPLLGAPVAAAQDDSFAACVTGLKRTAAERGISDRVVENGLGDVSRQTRVIELDRAQPEFTATFGDYLERRVTEERVERGRRLLDDHAQLLARIYREYGVPPRYLVAFWGMETNYGGYFGQMPVFDSLATLACDRRRGEYFTRQLMAALEIVDDGAIRPARMEGSWAGAMGHVQFMPSVFRRHAVDYDGDGRRDLWGSVADALASAANFLSALGWKPGWRWGREVTLPEDFPYVMAGGDKSRTVTEWHALGVRTAYGRPIPKSDARASLLVPSGHRGPAFLVYANFDVVMEWNRARFYALAVGHLADRLAGAEGLVNPPPDDVPRLRTEQVTALQERLNARGYDAGPEDGIPGPRTRAAIRRFQVAHGMVADGHPSRAVLDQLSLKVAERE